MGFFPIMDFLVLELRLLWNTQTVPINMSELAPRIPVFLVSCLSHLLAELSFFYHIKFIIKNDWLVVAKRNVHFLPWGIFSQQKENYQRNSN